MNKIEILRDSLGRFKKGLKIPEEWKSYGQIPANFKKYRFIPSFSWGYIIGAIKGDGSVYFDKNSNKGNYSISLHAGKSKTFAKNLQKLLGGTIWFDKKKKVFRFQFYSKRLCEIINNFDFSYKNKEFLKGFIQGFYDAEGSLDIRKDRKQGFKFIFVNTNYKLISYLSCALDKLKINYKIYPMKRENRKICYRLVAHRIYDAEKLKGILNEKTKDIIDIKVQSRKSIHSFSAVDAINPIPCKS